MTPQKVGPCELLEHWRSAFRGRAGPFAFVNLAAFDANAAELAGRSSKPIRLASKKHSLCRAA
ncbi:hypothetical protein [Deinococcus xinjiangensis]|uniref:hypothetical protein n=1 Tax=Deinococcus xinjiangensis TaxID=457454 RepID=UPI003365A271